MARLLRLPTLAAAVTLTLFACTLPGVKKLRHPETQDPAAFALLNPNSLSQPSHHYLKQQKLLRAHHDNPARVIDLLQQRLSSDASEEMRLTLIELCMDLGGRRAPSDSRTAVGYFLAAADTAYALEAQSPGPPRLNSGAVTAYNHSAGQVAKLLFATGYRWAEPTAIEGPWQTYWLELVSDDDTRIDPAFFDELEAAEYLKLEHTDVERIQRAGLGAAMVGYRLGDEAHREATPLLPSMGMAVPVNATLGFPDDSGRVEFTLHNLLRTDVAQMGGRQVALAADLTAPLVMLYDHIKEPRIAWKGLLHPETYADHMNIVQLEPFQPDKIPVIFTHGLVSSPKIWLPALNELNSDSLLRQHYQLFAFVYPTGFPIAYSAAALRARLQEFHARFDPHGDNPHMRNVLLVGHSMGGIVSNLQVRSSGGDALESRFFTSPIDELTGLAADQRVALKKLLIYRANPYITRVVFVASPHRGSETASGLTGSIGSALIEDPTDTVLTKPLPLVEGLTQVGYEIATQRLNGIESLKPYSPGLMAILEQPVREGVAYHSIIGRKNTQQPIADSSDGTVAYWSSHLDGAVSEKVVNAKHTPLAKHPEAIEELRRILYLHAGLPYAP